MNPLAPEPETENARIVSELRRILEPIALRLTPEVEPATIYFPRPEPVQKEPGQ